MCKIAQAKLEQWLKEAAETWEIMHPETPEPTKLEMDEPTNTLKEAA